MGGRDETVISGLRMHVSGNSVHVHDDARKLKFETSCKNFKEDMSSTFKDLEKKDGVVAISGKGNDLYFLKDGKNYSLFLSDKKSIKKDLELFLKSC